MRRTYGDDGGGIYVYDGALTIIGSTLTDNAGGVYQDDGSVVITDSTLTNNTDIVSGAIYGIDGSLTITGCTLAEQHGQFGRWHLPQWRHGRNHRQHFHE